MVPWMGSSPMAEVCLSGRGGGDLSDFGEQGVKGNICPATASGGKVKGTECGVQERMWTL